MSAPTGAIFLSYASEDSEAAQRIASALKVAGMAVWFDKSELRGGDAWDRHITEQIHDCRLFIAVISARTEARDEGYFRREWKLAVDRTEHMAEKKTFLVPVVIDDTSERSASVPQKFHEVQWTRLPGGVTPSEFIERIRRLLSPTELIVRSGGSTPTARLAPEDFKPDPAPPIHFWGRLKQNKVVEWTIAYAALAYALLKAVETFSKAFDWSNLGSRLVAFGYLAGLPITATLAWYHGHKGRQRVSGPELAILALLLLIAGSALWIVERSHSDASTSASRTTASSAVSVLDRSIAVLPFLDLSEKHDQEYFGDGLAEEVLSLLATLPDLKVISRTSSFQFKGKNADVRTVGEQLRAAYIVEGSVRRSANRVRVTAQLIGSQDGVHRWSDSYERNVGDVLQMQQDIAAALGRSLQVEVSGASWEQATTLKSTDAYTAYLRGLHAMDRFDKSGLEEAVGYFERAVSLDPSLLRAREKLAQTHYLLLELGLVPPKVGAEHLRASLDTVLRENPRSSLAHALNAELAITYDYDWAGAQREADMALGLSKNSSLALYAAGDLAGVLAQWDQAESFFRQALALDPLDADTQSMLSWALYHAGRFQEAEVEGRRTLEIRPSYTTAHFELGLYLLAQGKLQAALDEMQKETTEGARQPGLAIAFYALGRKSDSDTALRVAERDSASDFAYEIACAHAYRGEADAALHWLERAYDQKDYLLEYLKGEWALRSLESDQRYQAFLRKMKLPE